MQNDDQTAMPEVDTTAVITGLPPRTVVLEREIALARRQLDGYTRSLRHDGRTLGEEIEPPAQGDLRVELLAEIERLERHLEALSTPVVMPDLVLRGAPEPAHPEHALSMRR